jgi:hypothetical protein
LGQPGADAVGPPQPAQVIEDRLGQRHEPLLVPLPDDAQQQIVAVDRADLECRGLAGPQAASIHEREAGLVDWTPYAGQQATHLSVGQRLG